MEYSYGGHIHENFRKQLDKTGIKYVPDRPSKELDLPLNGFKAVQFITSVLRILS